jgi:hypothetical protein
VLLADLLGAAHRAEVCPESRRRSSRASTIRVAGIELKLPASQAAGIALKLPGDRITDLRRLALSFSTPTGCAEARTGGRKSLRIDAAVISHEEPRKNATAPAFVSDSTLIDSPSRFIN